MSENYPMVIEQVDKVVETIMGKEEFEAFKAHIKEGAPGFLQYLQSERVKKSIRALIDDYLEFLKKGQ